MHVLSTLIPALGFFAHIGSAAYTLEDDYGSASTFFDKFDFWTDPDPTNGFVNYVDRQTARQSGLTGARDGYTFIGVDHTNTASQAGRKSVRLTSTKSYNHGLVILDLAHMPGSICGSWPAFWMLGPDWPNNGEVDIIEGVNQQSSNQITLHTNSGCSINNSGFSGSLATSNCDVQAPGQQVNAGCTIGSESGQSYGDGFNRANGGIYATEWTSQSINVWFFPRGSAPSDISGGSPNPSAWGTPTAKFAGNCNIDSHFRNMQIVFDITFCGDWAGNTWSSSTCSSKANTCQDFVRDHPSAFAESYWAVNSLKVYRSGNSVHAGLGISPVASASLQVNVPGAAKNSPQPTKNAGWNGSPNANNNGGWNKPPQPTSNAAWNGSPEGNQNGGWNNSPQANPNAAWNNSPQPTQNSGWNNAPQANQNAGWNGSPQPTSNAAWNGSPQPNQNSGWNAPQANQNAGWNNSPQATQTPGASRSSWQKRREAYKYEQ